MPTPITIDANVNLNFRTATAQATAFQKQFQSGFNKAGGLKGITTDVNNFDNALGRATSRIVSLGAASVVFNTLRKSFGAFAEATVEVEQALAKINVNLGQSADGLKQFGGQIFNVARQTGSTFEEAAKGAEELARQGLGAEETLKRLSAALILNRTTGLGVTESIDSITSSLNTFNKEALTAADVVNRLAAVDTKFAVSSKDLAEAVQRVGSSAAEAGVSFNQLLAIVTSVQQTTQRGGATIGNALKTIFTRVGRPEVLDQLQAIGVAVKDTEGNTLPAIRVLQNLATTYDGLSAAQKNVVSRQVAGTFQINILKAALGDLNKEQSIYNGALKTAASAGDAAIQKNEQLNKTLASLLNSTKQSVTQLFASLGEQNLAPFTKALLGTFEKVRSFLSGGDTGDGIGKSLGEGILKGLANVLSGPGLLGLAVVLGKGFGKIIATIGDEVKGLLSINDASSKRAEIQSRINTLLNAATAAEKANLDAANSVLAKKEAILAISARIRQTELIGTPLQNAFLGEGLLGGPKITGPKKVGAFAKGIPHFADPLYDAIRREKAAGVPEHQIYVGKDQRLVSPDNPQGLGIANKRDEPAGLHQGVDRILSQGGDPKKAGHRPNFAATPPSRAEQTQAQQEIRSLFGQLEKVKTLGPEFEKLGSQIFDASKKLSKVAQDNALGKLADQSTRLAIATTRLPGKTQYGSTPIGPASFINAGKQYGSKPIGPSAKEFNDIQKELAKQTALAEKAAARTASVKNARINSGNTGDSLPAPNEGPSTAPRPTLYGPINADTRGFNARARTAAGLPPRGPKSFSSYIGPDIVKEEREKAIRADETRQKIRDLATKSRRPEYQVPSVGDSLIENAVRYDTALPGIEARKTRLQDEARRKAVRQLAIDQSRAERQGGISAQNERLTNLRPRLQAEADAKRAADIENTFQRSQNRRRNVVLKGRERQSVNRNRLGNATLAAAFVLPAAAGFIDDGEGGTTNGKVRGGIKGALQGGGVGAVLGPIGAGVGAAVGGLIGYFSKLSKSIEEFNAEVDKGTEAQTQSVEAISHFAALGSQLREATDASPQARSRLVGERSTALSKIDPEFRAALSKQDISAEETNKILAQAQDKLARIANSAENTKKLNAINSADSGFGANIASKTVRGSLFDRLLNPRADVFQSTKNADSLSGGFLEAIKANGGLGKEDRTFVNRSLANGGPQQGDVDKVNKILESLGQAADATTDNFLDVVQALSKGNTAFIGFGRILADQTKQAQEASNRLPNNALTSRPNLDVFGTAASVGRNPLSNNGTRAQSRFDFFNELSSSGAVDKGTFEETKPFKQARAGVQANNVGDLAIRFLQNNNPAVGNLRDSRGNPQLSSIQRILETIANGGGANADLAKILSGLIPKVQNTLKDVGVKTRSSPLNFASGDTGTTYGIAATSTSGSKGAFITKDNVASAIGARSRNGRFITKDTIASEIDKRAANRPAQKGDTLKQQPSAEETAAVKAVQEANASAAKVADILANSTLKIAVDVKGMFDEAGNVKFAEILQNVLQQIADVKNQAARDRGTPNPPSPSIASRLKAGALIEILAATN